MKVFHRHAHIFFIGGAADLEPYYFVGPLHNITIAQKKLARQVKKYLAHHANIHFHSLSYNRVYYLSDIELNVLVKIQPQDLIYIIGHSLGGWNATHLARILKDKGYRVRILATLDPVGEGTLVWMGSNIFKNPEPKPLADFWINIQAENDDLDLSDIVAQIGRQWLLSNEPDINEKLYIHHSDAQRMLRHKLHTGKSIMDYIIENIRQLL
ncbi:hydrolase [Actinobacillus pleuropneumoniae]|uniref:hydrolase n=1 Tax=Actinobacillus pleuropneumoniae TaxID=715 RepID=UPI001F3929CB|nr:hydrolase [Actinobacillus pleuropneumoniae]UKH15659.1 hydrolase [Actinobacillus pleuropneumoniae]